MALLTFALVAMLATTLAMTFVVSEGEGDAISHTDEPWQITAALNLEPYLPAGDTWPILDLTASALLPEYAFAQTVNAFILTAAGSITDTTNLELDGARGIAIYESGGSRYAAVTGFSDDGVQILDITDPDDITAAGSITDTTSLELDGARDIAIYESGGSRYAVVTASADNGVQILDITDPANIIAADSVTYNDGLKIVSAWSVAVFESGGSRYAAVTGFYDDGVQILDITNPADITAAGSITDTTSLELDGARGIAIYESGGSRYAAVTGYYDDGVQILDITDPDDITAAGSITDTTSLELDGARDIAIYESGGSRYAAVTANDDNGVQILDITDPDDITAAGSITDTTSLKLDTARGIAIYESGTSRYAAITASVDDGVQILDITNPADITAAGSITETTNLELDGAEAITVFESGTSRYAAVAAFNDDGVQIIRIDSVMSANPRLESIERFNPSSATTNSQSLIYRATFSESVTGVNTSDFVLSTGGGNAGTNSAISISGSGSVYYVTISAAQDGTYNLDLVSSGHNIADYSSNPLTNTATTGADETYTVSTAVTDTANPRLESIERFNPSSATTNSQSLVYRATFSESVTGVTASDFTLSPASTGGGGTTTTSPGQFTQTRSSNLAIPDDDTVSDTITVPNSGTATSVSVAIDITHTWIGDLKITLIAPDGTTQTLHDRSGGSADDINQTYTPSFGSIPISGVWTLQINDNYDADPGTLNNWTLTINYGTGSQTVSPVTGVSGSGDTYYVTVSSTADGTYNLDLVSSGHNIADYSSNPLTNTATTGTDETYTVSTAVTDTANPRLESIERYSPASQNTDSQSLIYRATFSESVTGVTASDFTLSPASTVVPPPPVTTSPGQFTQTRSSNLAIPDDDTVSDTITVPNSGTATSVSVAIDITHTWIGDLKITLIAPDGTTQTLHDRSGGSADDINQTYTPSFGSIPISGVWTLQINDNYDADPGTLNNWTLTINYGTGSQTVSPVTGVSGSGDTYYVTVSSTADGTYNLDLVSSGHNIADYSSNPLTNTATTGTDETYTVSTAVTDTANPRLESIERYSPASQNTDSQSLIYRATFSESVTGVTASDFTLSPASTGSGNNGTSPVTGVSGSGNTYYVTVSAAQDGTYNLDLVSSGHGIKDAADNSLTNATPTTGADEMYTVSITVTDTAAPTILSIERNNPSSAVTSARVLTYKVTFSDDVTGVDKADFVLSPDSTGSTSSYIPVVYVGGSGSMYTVVVITLNDGTYNLDLVSSGHGIADTDDNLLTNIVPVTGTDETYTYTAAN